MLLDKAQRTAAARPRDSPPPRWYVGALTQGNDGGSIAKRDDLVRTKPSTETADQDEVRHSLWTQCRLSKAPLARPVMADRLGQLYNKDGVIEYLLRRARHEATDAENKVAGHLRGLKDVREVALTPNPVRRDADDKLYYPYACPLTQRALNGKFRAVCLWPCGCVLSESGLRETAARTDEPTAACPVCSASFRAAALREAPVSAESDVVYLNPPAREQDALREQLAARRTKRKKTDAGADAKRVRARLPTLNDAAPGAYAASEVRRAQANAALNAPPAPESEAVASLYRKTPSKRDVWLGRQAS